MSTTNASWAFENRARRDLDRCRKFLRRTPGSRPIEQVREIMNAVRFLRDYPRLHPVAGISRAGLPLRRRNAGRFAVVYSYFEPSPSDPRGLVSIRAIRHATEEDVLWGVEERRTCEQRQRPSYLLLK